MKEKIVETKEYYDKRFGALSQELNEEETIRWNAIASVLKEHSQNKKLKIADFGCGRGWLSNKLSAFGEVTGFDVSEKAVENAKKSFPALNFICLDASVNIPADLAGKFDLVVSSEVIEHIEDQLSYARNMHTLLKPAGHFLITTPNGKWFQEFYKDGRESWKQPIENWLTPDSLVQLFKSAGLAGIHATTFNSEWIFALRPRLKTRLISYPLTRKLLKGSGLYKFTLQKLNVQGYGINSLLYGKKPNA